MQNRLNSRTKSHGSRIVLLAMFVVMSSIIYVIEVYIPVPIPLPGFKWGFSNSIVLIVLLVFGSKEAFSVAVLKSFLGSLLAGRLFSPVFFIGFTGGIAGIITMIVFLKKFRNGVILTSIYGSFINNIFQLTVSYLFFIKSEFVFVYLPYVSVIGFAAAILNVYIAIGGIKWMENLNIR